MNYSTQLQTNDLKVAYLQNAIISPNKEVLKLIRSGSAGREKVANSFYQNDKLKNGIKKVLSKICNLEEHDFWHVFDYTIVSFFKSVLKKPNFEIKKNLHSYLFVISKNIWLQELKKRGKNNISLENQHSQIESKECSAQLMIEHNELKELLRKVLNNLKKSHKEVLSLWASGFSMKEIQLELNLTSIEATRKRKFDALKKLNQYFNNNPGKKVMLLKVLK